jgi:MHS family citrate/tricarballylate:H+ symporter-like MFS transporter
MAGDPGAVEATLKSRIGAILRSTSGNFLEMFDFFLFGFYGRSSRRATRPPSCS